MEIQNLSMFAILWYSEKRNIWITKTDQRIQWSDSNFIPMDSKKFEFRNFDYIIRFAMKNESGIEKFRSRDQRIFEENRFYEIKTLTHNHVNTISDKRNWTGSSDSTCNLVLLTEVSWRRDYVMWRNYEKSIFLHLSDSRVADKASINICTYFESKF